MDIQKMEKKVFKNNFVEHVFKFDDEEKSDLLNGVQYIFFAVLLVTVLNLALGRIMTDADESKGDVELVGEIMVHLIFMFVGLLLIDRIITFIPTYSGSEHKAINIMTLIFVFIVLQVDSESILGRKMRMLLERVNRLWEGEHKGAGENQGQGQAQGQGQGQVIASQPISGQQISAPQIQTQNIMAPPPTQPTQFPSQMQQNNIGVENQNLPSFGGPVAANSLGGFTSF